MRSFADETSVENFRIRSFHSSDYPSLKAVHDRIFPDNPLFLERIRYEDSCYGRTRYKMNRFVAETVTGRVVGFGEYRHLFFGYHPKRFAVGIEVSPDWRRRGIGSGLYGLLMKQLARLGAEVATPMILSRDHESSEGASFAANRGFLEKRRIIESRLDLGSLDAAVLGIGSKKFSEQGISLVDLRSEMLRDPSAGSRLKDLEDSGAGDVPGMVSDTPMDLHDFKVVVLENPTVVWEGSFVARIGDAYIGESSLLRSGMDDTLEQGFTVVRPGFRGRGVAQAVKTRAASYAKTKGFRFIRTYNDAENAPMLSINRKMGFVKRAEWIVLEKELG
jgi:GNAT superfamily N-acetyltransferase